MCVRVCMCLHAECVVFLCTDFFFWFGYICDIEWVPVSDARWMWRVFTGQCLVLLEFVCSQSA